MKISVVLLLAASLGFAQKLPPVDESPADPGFAGFRTALLRTLQRKDVSGLLNAVDPKIRVSFGEPDGPATFRRYWKLDRPSQSKIWTELEAVLRLGATRDESEFIAPYVFTRFPQTLDAYTHAAVIRPGVILRAQPSPAGKPVATLQYDIVQLQGERRSGWVAVVLQDGTAGWVRQTEIRSPLDYRAFFEQRGGRWKLTAFINDD